MNFKVNFLDVKFINSIFFVVLMFFSFYFGKISATAYDGSLALYKIHEFNTLYYLDNRWPTIIYSFFPILISKLGMSFKMVLYAHIISYNMLPLLIFVWFRFVLKQEKYLSVFLISTCFFYFHSFFVGSLDTIKMHYFIFFLYYLLDVKYKNRKLQYVLVFALMSILIIGHIGQFVSITILVGYMVVSKELKVKLSYLLIFAIAIILVKMIFLKGDYESGMISNFAANYKAILHLNSNDVLLSFLKSIRTYNLIVLVVFIVLVVRLMLSKKYLLTLYFISATLGMLAFVAIFFEEFGGYYWYTEPHFKSIALLIALIFVNHCFEPMKKMSVIFQSSIYVYFLSYLLIMGLDYKKYYNYIAAVGNGLEANTLFLLNDSAYQNTQRPLPIQSAIINLSENKNCHYFAFQSNEILDEIKNEIPNNQLEGSDFCFNDEIIVVEANSDMRSILELKYKWYFHPLFN